MKHRHHATAHFDETVLYCSTIVGSSGDDFIVNDSNASMLIQGGDGKDWIGDEPYDPFDPSAVVRPATNDRYEGGFGKDFINSESGNDVIYGNAGDDYIQSTSKDLYTFIDGGMGDDTAHLYGIRSNFTETDVNGHQIFSNGHRTFELVNVEHISFGTDTFQF